MQLIIAHYERLTIKERITAVMDHKRKNGKRITRTDRLPYGYRLEGDTVVPHADEMAAIDLAKEERSRGKNYATIARLLHARGITLRGKPLDRHTARRLATSSASASG
jgi:DNA invertase Pin-like site-specific DNA recombinase